MATMNPKDFIRTVLIKEVGEIHETHPYFAFIQMAIGIEFLGKCLNTYDDWNESGRSKKDFELAINSLSSFNRYIPLLSSHNLWDSLRNGLTHTFTPKETLSLSSKAETAHMVNISATQINLRCEDFYIDFKKACEDVLAKVSFDSNKMNRDLLVVPDSPSSDGSLPPTHISYSGTT